jgi:hypothetical protein
MADITKNYLVADSAISLNSANGEATQDVLMNCADEKMIIMVTNSDATTARIKIKAGDGIQSVLGDYSKDIVQNGSFMFGPLTSARFKDMDTGKVTVTVTGTNDAAFGGTVANIKIRAIVLP